MPQNNYRDRRFAIMLPTDGAYGTIGKAVGSALTELGVEGLLFKIPGINPQAVQSIEKNDLCAKLVEYRVSDIFTINIPSHALKLPDSLLYHLWYQDLPVFPTNRKNDRVWMPSVLWRDRYGMGKYFPPATEYGQYFREVREQDYDAEISFAGFYPELFVHDTTEPGMAEKLNIIIQAILNELELIRCLYSDRTLADAQVMRAEIQTGVFLNPFWREVMIRHVMTRIVRWVQRDPLIRFLIEVCNRRNWRLKLAGSGCWNTVPEFMPYYNGLIESGENLARFYQRSKINIQVNGDSNLHYRVLECLACGSFVMAERHISDDRPGGVREILNERQMPTWTDNKDLEEKLAYYLSHDQERRAAIAEGGKIIRRDHNYRQRMRMLLEETHEPVVAEQPPAAVAHTHAVSAAP